MRSILLVDDEAYTIRALTQHVGWEKLNLRIAGTAGSGSEALALYRRLRPDLVMTDVYMPGMNGLELTQALRQENPDLPIVILSGYEEFENARQAMRWGVNHFLLKPASVAEIESVLEELLMELEVSERKRQLEERYKLEIGRMLPYLREKFLLELLSTRFRPEEILRERLEYLEIPRPRELLAVSMQIVRPAFLSKLKERDWQLLKFGAGNIVRETLQEEMASSPGLQGYALDYSDQLFVLLLCGLTDGADDRLKSFAEELACRTMAKITNYLKIEANAGIGSVKRELPGFLDSYLESREALEAAEFQGTGRVYPYEEYGGMHAAVDDCAYLLKQWTEALTGKELAEAAEKWAHIRARLHEDPASSIADVQTVCVGLFSSLLHFWNDHFPPVQPPHTMSQFLKEIQQHYTLSGLTGWIDGLISEWLKAAGQELSAKKGNRLVDSVKKYVEAHYNEEISFASIAKELFVHPKYLSQLFKRVTGENFVSYLNRYRINKAIRYLESGRYMVYEVSEMVGYNNPTYFSQVFKMISGKSPSDYLIE